MLRRYFWPKVVKLREGNTLLSSFVLIYAPLKPNGIRSLGNHSIDLPCEYLRSFYAKLRNVFMAFILLFEYSTFFERL